MNPNLKLDKEEFHELLKGQVTGEMFDKIKSTKLPGVIMSADPEFIKAYYKFDDEEMEIFNLFILNCKRENPSEKLLVSRLLKGKIQKFLDFLGRFDWKDRVGTN